MKRVNKFLYDDIGNAHERKNEYLKELATLYTQYEETKDRNKLNQIKTLKQKKKQHPYDIALEAFIKKEKMFLHQLKSKKKDFLRQLPPHLSKKMQQLNLQLWTAQEKNTFYKAYEHMSYEAAYAYEKSMIELHQLPFIMKHLEENELELKKSLENKKHIDPVHETKARGALKKLKHEQKNKLKDSIRRLKDKRKDRHISKKALHDGIRELKIQCKEAIHVGSYELPHKSNKECIKNRKYEIKHHTKRKINVLQSNIADLRRKTPTEIERTMPLNGPLTFLLPGVGQLLNRQYIKAMLFFLVSFFIYAIAIPYALGFGNYQGEGIAGLVSLAEGGRKIDKSLIFMIEGIIAILLTILAILFMYLSFLDAYRVERDKIKGIRPKNWFETKTSVLEDGFPYMVSLPALITTIFIVLVPITTAVLISFTNMDPKHQSKFAWIGLKNYRLIALGEGIAGKAFWLILGWTIVWTLVATTLAIVIGFFLAILVNNERIKGKVIFRSVYLLPWAVPSFITVMFFSIMFSPNGALTEIISSIFGQQIVVKNDPNLSRLTLILIQSWLGSSYVFLLSTGVLQSIPGDLYEAAQIDGATAWQKLKRITLPIVLFQTAPLLVGQYTFNFNNFSTVYLFNTGGPFNPTKYGNLAGTTDLLISYIFKLTTEKQYQAIGAAITVVISLGLMLFAFIGFKNSKAFREEKL